MKNVKWITGNDSWWDFWGVDLSLDLLSRNPEGVYVIWSDEKVLYVGQGDIKTRIEVHRNEPAFAPYRGQNVFFTWCKVDPNSRDGIEYYLADHYRPSIGQIHPDVAPIQVNLIE